MTLCTKCNTEKDETEFYKCGPNRRGGLTYWCKTCYAKQYADNRERQKKSNRRASIRRRYGLSVDEYEKLIAQGRCSACGETDRKLVLDHCHATNAVRAPLCQGCNIALGGARDRPDVLRALADYLERHAAP